MCLTQGVKHPAVTNLSILYALQGWLGLENAKANRGCLSDGEYKADHTALKGCRGRTSPANTNAQHAQRTVALTTICYEKQQELLTIMWQFRRPWRMLSSENCSKHWERQYACDLSVRKR